MPRSKTLDLEKILLLVWFTVNLGVGALTVHEYGMSIDEPNNYRYAADTLDAYPSFFGVLYEPNYDSSYDGHGPAFVVIAGTLIKLVQRVSPDVFAPDLWHFSYFVTFQLTGLCLYWLAKRWFSKWTAWGLLMLFGTQPLLLGHAFINPKDIPFMFFLTFSIVLGFRMADSLVVKEPFVSLERPAGALMARFQETDPRRRRRFLTHFGLALSTALILIAFSKQVDSLIQHVVSFFYNAEPESWAGRIFGSIASSTSGIPAEDYAAKAIKLFHRVELGFLVAGILVFLVYFGLLIGSTDLPGVLRQVWGQRHKPGAFMKRLAGPARNSVPWDSLKIWFTELFRAFRDPRVILAGVVLGLATGVRAIAPFAGLIVFLYLLIKVRSRAWATAAAYFLIAGIITYLAWPRLWDAPLQRYLEGLGMISNFPHFPGQVLFNGRFYGPRDLPRSYLPVLLSIQFTEPLSLGIYLGMGIVAWRLLRDRLRADLLLYVGLGFTFPLFAVILLNSPLYHNFRQTLFIIPAMCMLAAFPLEWLFRKITLAWARVLLIAALALPGVQSAVRLYPYQYVYYNSLVGGPAGALNRYELDYWRISLREMAFELNELAPPGSIIVVTRSAGLLARYARPDLIVDKPIDSTLDLSRGYDYVVQVSRWQKWDMYPDIENVVTIERDGLVLATAKNVKNLTRK
jgi:4-amino-4-deoxy-L-arabinose transferase-like glycosyltransferase